MRLIALVDGFNVYHGIVAAEREIQKIDALNAANGKEPQRLGGRSFHWLDIPGLLRGCLPNISREARIVDTIYFSAFAYHAGEDRVERHKLYVRALEGFGVKKLMSNFKDKEIRCPKCKTDFTRKEEKETDVAMACALVEAALSDSIDGYILFSGDSDQLPAIRLARRLAPGKPIYIVFPFRRFSKEMRNEAKHVWNVDIKLLDRHRWEKSLTLPSGEIISRPVEYDG